MTNKIYTITTWYNPCTGVWCVRHTDLPGRNTEEQKQLVQRLREACDPKTGSMPILYQDNHNVDDIRSSSERGPVMFVGSFSLTNDHEGDIAFTIKNPLMNEFVKDAHMQILAEVDGPPDNLQVLRIVRVGVKFTLTEEYKKVGSYKHFKYFKYSSFLADQIKQ